jgi:hypothetical protein
MSYWTSRAVGFVLWLQLLNVSMAVVAALPVSVVLCWIIKGSRRVLASLIGATTALVHLAGLQFSGYSLIGDGSPHQFALWLDTTVQVLSLGLAVPLFVWAIGALPSNHPLERTRS